jgi:hypothetical protein
MCCNCFQVFHVFFQVFQTHVLNVSSVFIRILQVLYLDVSKVDRVLHLSSPSAASPRCLLFLDVGDARTTWAHVGQATCMGRKSFEWHGTRVSGACGTE